MKFKGDFKILKKMGFKFQKLYARNYKVYEKNGVWIWVAGRDVEVKDFYSNSHEIIELILSGKYPVYEEDFDPGNVTSLNFPVLFKKGEPRSCMLNRNTGEIVTHKQFLKRFGSLLEYQESMKDEEWRELHLNVAIMETIKELGDYLES